MNGRERVFTALALEEPDRVPVDFGSTWITTITIPAYERLKRHFGVTSDTVVMERSQQVCMVDESILKASHVDTRGVFYGPPDHECNQYVTPGEERLSLSVGRHLAQAADFVLLRHVEACLGRGDNSERCDDSPMA